MRTSRTKTLTTSRPLDYAYDPNFIASGPSDMAKAAAKASTATTVASIPVYKNMFSSGANYPSTHVTARAVRKSKGGVGPKTSGAVSRSGAMSGAESAAMAVLEEGAGRSGGAVVARMTAAREPNPVAHAAVNRAKYLARPLGSNAALGAVEAILAPTPPPPTVHYEGRGVVDGGGRVGSENEPAGSVEVNAKGRPVRTVATQSVYRESEAQTDPFTPDFAVDDSQAPPEVLTLAALAWGSGLPAGLAEVEMIERARARRAFEASLPPATAGEDGYEARRQALEEQELAEWVEREKQIGSIQEERLELLKTVLAKREATAAALTQERLDAASTRRAEARENALNRVAAKRVKALRKLADARKNLDMGPSKRDIIAEYADYGSRAYAAPARSGAKPEPGTVAALQAVRPAALKSYGAVAELESVLHPSVMNSLIEAPALPQSAHARRAATVDSGTRPKTTGVPVVPRKVREVQAHLEYMQATLTAAKQEAPPRVPLTLAHKIERPPPRPPTPNAPGVGPNQVSEKDIDDEEGEEAMNEPTLEMKSAEDARRRGATFLQALLRGRAVQNAMYEGKSKRLELINELRTFETIKQVDEETAWRLEEASFQASRSNAVNGAIAAVTGEVVGQTLDFLSKELTRRREEARIAAMVQLAERRRRMREAVESGRRQAEEARRAAEDEVFGAVMATHGGTVDTYLESVIAGATEGTARDRAIHEAVVTGDAITSVVEKIEEAKLDTGVVVEDLVSAFLLPEVNRAALRRQVAEDQRKFTVAAGEAVREAAAVVAAREQQDKMNSSASMPQQEPALVEESEGVEGAKDEKEHPEITPLTSPRSAGPLSPGGAAPVA